MRRRQFITALGGAAAWPLAARAQQPAMPVIGFLNGQSPALFSHLVAAFGEGLRDGGFIEGRNVVIEYRWADGQDDRLPQLASELVSRGVTLLAAGGSVASTLAAKAATATIPIVFVTGADPVRHGYVASLNRPGGNVTGVSFLAIQLNAKRLDFARQLVVNNVPIGVLLRPTNPAHRTDMPEFEAAATSLGRKVVMLEARNEDDFAEAFAGAVRQQVGLLLVLADPFFNSHRKALVALAARFKVPAVYEFRDFVTAGGLISYGTSVSRAYRESGRYAGRILNGEKPADLPVLQSTRFELVINLNTAKALGLTIPPTLLALADEVIE